MPHSNFNVGEFSRWCDVSKVLQRIASSGIFAGYTKKSKRDNRNSSKQKTTMHSAEARSSDAGRASSSFVTSVQQAKPRSSARTWIRIFSQRGTPMHTKAIGIGVILAHLIDWTLGIGLVGGAGYLVFHCSQMLRWWVS